MRLATTEEELAHAKERIAALEAAASRVTEAFWSHSGGANDPGRCAKCHAAVAELDAALAGRGK